jgi:hypothetical protein
VDLDDPPVNGSRVIHQRLDGSPAPRLALVAREVVDASLVGIHDVKWIEQAVLRRG